MTLTARHLTVAVAVSLAALFGATALLGSIHEERRTARAEGHLEQAHALAARGELEAAVRQYRAALALERGHPEAEQALALTLLSLGRLSEAESYLSELLRRDPTSGPLNRGMARILASRDDDAGTRAFYQRAIYGQWPDELPTGRMDTRFELLEHLRALGAREEVLAELLRVKAELPPAETAAARRVADLLVEAREPEAAVDTLRAARAGAPEDVDLLAQLADTEATAGAPTEARTTLREALKLAPDRDDLRDRLTVINRVLQLDPTLPRLRLSTRVSRARQLLSAVVAQTTACADADGADAEAREDAARRLRRRAPVAADVAEQELALAVRLWTTSPECRAETPEARAIAQILDRVQVTDEPSV